LDVLKLEGFATKLRSERRRKEVTASTSSLRNFERVDSISYHLTTLIIPTPFSRQELLLAQDVCSASPFDFACFIRNFLPPTTNESRSYNPQPQHPPFYTRSPSFSSFNFTFQHIDRRRREGKETQQREKEFEDFSLIRLLSREEVISNEGINK